MGHAGCTPDIVQIENENGQNRSFLYLLFRKFPNSERINCIMLQEISDNSG
jgi:hypothetical protein